jgi:hypothetical protein
MSGFTLEARLDPRIETKWRTGSIFARARKVEKGDLGWIPQNAICLVARVEDVLGVAVDLQVLGDLI